MALDNLVKINQLNNEPPDKNEFEGLVKAAVDRLNDSQYVLYRLRVDSIFQKEMRLVKMH